MTHPPSCSKSHNTRHRCHPDDDEVSRERIKVPTIGDFQNVDFYDFTANDIIFRYPLSRTLSSGLTLIKLMEMNPQTAELIIRVVHAAELILTHMEEFAEGDALVFRMEYFCEQYLSQKEKYDATHYSHSGYNKCLHRAEACFAQMLALYKKGELRGSDDSAVNTYKERLLDGLRNDVEHISKYFVPELPPQTNNSNTPATPPVTFVLIREGEK